MSGQDLARLLDDIPVIVWETTHKLGPYGFVSAHAETLLGHGRKEWLQDAGFFARHVAPEDLERVAAARQRCLETGAAYTCDYRMSCADGRTLWLRESAVAHDHRLRGIAYTIEELKSLERQAIRLQRTELLGRLVGGVAHDFNNLLMAMMGYSDIVYSLLAADHEARPHTKELKTIVERGTRLVRQLLSFSRSPEPERTLISLNSLVEGMGKMLRRLVEENVTLRIRVEEGLELVCVDGGQLEQVLLNLVVNARDAMPRGGDLTIETASVEGAEALALSLPEGRYAVLRVSDTGCGMSPETQARIFEAFFTTKGADSGTGLGLSIVQRVIEQNQGHIRVQSEVGQGTRFEVFLPRVQATAVLPVSEEDRAQLIGSGTILVVEDDHGLLASISAALRRYGYQVIEAGGARDALDLITQSANAIDLMLTDVVMPEMSGADLARLVAAERPGVKVIYMSGHGDQVVVQQLVGTQAPVVLRKPFTFEDLGRQVHNVLGTGQGQ